MFNQVSLLNRSVQQFRFSLSSPPPLSLALLVCWHFHTLNSCYWLSAERPPSTPSLPPSANPSSAPPELTLRTFSSPPIYASVGMITPEHVPHHTSWHFLLFPWPDTVPPRSAAFPSLLLSLSCVNFVGKIRNVLANKIWSVNFKFKPRMNFSFSLS